MLVFKVDETVGRVLQALQSDACSPSTSGPRCGSHIPSEHVSETEHSGSDTSMDYPEALRSSSRPGPNSQLVDLTSPPQDDTYVKTPVPSPILADPLFSPSGSDHSIFDVSY